MSGMDIAVAVLAMLGLVQLASWCSAALDRALSGLERRIGIDPAPLAGDEE